jgi:hypothetical protein
MGRMNLRRNETTDRKKSRGKNDAGAGDVDAAADAVEALLDYLSFLHFYNNPPN